MSLRIRRGLSTDLPTPVEGELLYTTDNGNLYVGFLDPETDSIVPKLTSGQLIDDPNPTLAADLDLAGNSIIGVGNIQIDGTVFASGNINLGNDSADEINFTGQINTALIPSSDGAYDLGTQTVRWRTGYFEGLDIDSTLNVENISVTNILKADSELLYQSDTDSVRSSTFIGNLEGDVIGFDSTVLVSESEQTISNGSVSIVSDTILSDTNVVNLGSNELPLESIDLTYTNKFTINGITTDGFGGAFLTTAQQRSNGVEIVGLAAGDFLGGIDFFPYADADTQLTAGIFGMRQDSSIPPSPSDSAIASEFVVAAADNTAVSAKVLTFNYEGILNTPVWQSNGLSQTEIDALTPVNGMVVYNTTDDKFQGYEGGVWKNLIP